ncbi:MAG: beta-ketoacyl-[acyl-carrier-protein] synthase II [Bacteroidota bacterium]|nr:beta-ketoacyl-[acyl-carrier-protein] synthase II [Bacteroidota bacterium]MDP4214737.1 beta-ketoacyl-[acyl-carrier-protein] synthase II [Bacteroidota bacterium]MDP4253292.1 beta-ketoacyl-[acyl-carrier-protein] synthase II [Bacteroidota bacterium]MDP4257674.1 beta-ketoacyl-[acyl-carrier-protein] synthase II [Bacteroidota bacterium]
MKKVVVTGLGAITPLGNDVNTFWSGLVNGHSGAGPITKFDASKFKTRFACEVRGFDPSGQLDRNEMKRTDLFTQYALVAASQAIRDAGLDFSAMDPFDTGVIWGTGQGGMQTFEDQVTEYALSGAPAPGSGGAAAPDGPGSGPQPRFSPFFVPKLIANMASGMISIKYGLMGINYTTVSACATSNTAIMDALTYIRMGKAKVMVTGGSEAPVTQASVGGFSSMKALSTRNDDPTHASRPFDVSRDGFVMGEGGGALVLEEYEHARKRGARIYAELAGAAMTADAYHMTATHPEGLGALRAMQLALEDSGINKEEVDYLNAHATSTPVGDLSEVQAITRLFGADPENLFISATKSMTGHLLGAAGAIEAIACILSIRDSILPPTINTLNLDPEIPAGLKIILGSAKTASRPVRVAMSNTFGFGGHNGIVVFRRIS